MIMIYAFALRKLSAALQVVKSPPKEGPFLEKARAMETIVVNLHGALISTSVALSVGMKIEICVHLTGKRLI